MIEDNDERILHILSESEGADITRRYFKNTSGEYLMAKCTQLERYNLNKFTRFIYMGKAMLDYAKDDDLDSFKRLFAEADDKELMFWHVQKAFKAVVKAKKLKFIEFIIEDLDLPLGDHEAFGGMLHMFIFQCQEAEMEKNEMGIEINR
jgi:hypothetical protein